MDNLLGVILIISVLIGGGYYLLGSYSNDKQHLKDLKNRSLKIQEDINNIKNSAYDQLQKSKKVSSGR